MTGKLAFVALAAGNYRLTVALATRNAGDPTGVPPAPNQDADGVSQPQGPRVDISAYEWRGYWRYLPLVSK